jgi:hypothetical protein
VDAFAFYAFLREQNHFASNEELAAIVRRIDTDGDELVSYQEFENFLPPSNPRQQQLRERTTPIQYLTNCHVNKLQLPCLNCDQVPPTQSVCVTEATAAAEKLLQVF